MPDEPVIEIKRTPWPGQQPGSPVLPPSDMALLFKLGPAHALTGDTVALLAALRVPGKYVELYGGRLAGALQIVAIDQRTGAVYSNSAETSQAVPLTALRSSALPVSTGAVAVSAEQYVNVDLCDQLGLPPEGGRFSVFLWLDEMLSAVQEATIPPAKDRPGHTGLPGIVPPGIHFAKSPHPPLAGKITLVLKAGGIGSPLIAGTLGVPDGKESGTHLVTLLLDERERTVMAWPVNWSGDATRENSFELQVASLYPPGAIPAKLFVVVAAGTLLSNALAVEHPRR